MLGLGSTAVSPDERRAHVREPSNDPAKLVTATGQVLSVTVVDRSLRGLRIHHPDAASLPTEVTLLSPGAGTAFMARVVWRTAPYAGLLVTKSIDMRSATGADAATLRKLWREHIVS